MTDDVDNSGDSTPASPRRRPETTLSAYEVVSQCRARSSTGRQCRNDAAPGLPVCHVHRDRLPDAPTPPWRRIYTAGGSSDPDDE